MLGTVLGTWNITVNKTDKASPLMQLIILEMVKEL